MNSEICTQMACMIPKSQALDAVRVILKDDRMNIMKHGKVMVSTWAYAKARVEPQEPPKTCHFSILRWPLNFSMSLTRSQVVLSSKQAVLQKVGYMMYGNKRDSRCRFPSTSLVKKDDLEEVWDQSDNAQIPRVVDTLYFSGLKNSLSFGSVPPPGPPIGN